MIDIITKIVKEFFDEFDEWREMRQKAGSAHAEEKAARADDMAKRCATEEEAEKYRAIANVWREVADNFRKENEKLKAKVNELLDLAKSTAARDLEALDVGAIVLETKGDLLSLSGSGQRPALPAPEAVPSNERDGCLNGPKNAEHERAIS
ncbi:MAG TPA: hypothetical protein VF278_17365 [Pirellulales bacterium]